MKRPDQTAFVFANPSDTVETIITRLLEMTKAPFAADQIKLVYNGSIMDASHTLSHYTSVDGDTVQEIRCHGTSITFPLFARCDCSFGIVAPIRLTSNSTNAYLTVLAVLKMVYGNQCPETEEHLFRSGDAAPDLYICAQ